MYNIADHYENIYHYLCTIIAGSRVIYLHPFGSTQPENIEYLRNDTIPNELQLPTNRTAPMFIFYDQEPLDANYNDKLFKWITENTKAPWILVNTEKHSHDKNQILEKFSFAEINYFFHIFAAADWFRGHKYLPGLLPPTKRKLKKTYISFNRITSNKRVYRSLLVNELYKNNLLDAGYISYSKLCPDTNESFSTSIRAGVPGYTINSTLKEEAISNIYQLPELRIDFPEQTIPNQSMLLSPMKELMESFIFLVTETCYFESKTHLTEKIFKPIVLRMPFILVGCAHNLKYLRSYGFKTFGDFWDESYDTIEDPILRLQAITKILKDMSKLSTDEQQDMLANMQPILEHNYNLFNNPDFVRKEWNYLTEQLSLICEKYKYVPPYTYDARLMQSIPSPK